MATGAFLGGTAGAAIDAGCAAATAGVCAAGAPLLIAGGATAGAATGVVVANVVDSLGRAWDQLSRLVDNATTTGPPAIQYALVATRDGVYPSVRGGMVQLNAGDVWKYGTTVDPEGRYSGTALDALNVRMQPEVVGSVSQVLVAEKIQLIQYAATNGTLPPGNKIFK